MIGCVYKCRSFFDNGWLWWWLWHDNRCQKGEKKKFAYFLYESGTLDYGHWYFVSRNKERKKGYFH